ncbi:hypothetical protein N566_01920 [Streptomycetaceae bacterium MP113-05]|nr:hypothetical protein N566_01920 [Streptomycetaceae bacterium MP113-05]
MNVQFSHVQLEIGADPAEVGRARGWTRDRLTGCGFAAVEEQLAETVVLLVSELVTNAVVHTGHPAALRMSMLGGALRVEVLDGSRSAPVPRHAERKDTSGRGLELVSRLADRWGWHRVGDGKRVWCEFDRTSGAGSVAGADDCSRGQDRAAGSPMAPPGPRTPLTLRPTH